jgi:exodeoxyribonuclease VII small subunit
MTAERAEPGQLSFEDALGELEGIVSQLEAGDLLLEDALELFERGQELAAHCNALLEAASLRVEQLTTDGEIVEIEAE